MKLLLPEDYQPDLEARFGLVQQRLARALPWARIEHVGASAIPGALSKGDLDVCAIVPQARFDEALSRVRMLGYAAKSGTLQTDRLRMLVPVGAQDEHAVQLVAERSEFDFFVTFRDLLRADPLLVEAYNTIKRNASSLDEEGYRQAKSAFIKRVLDKK